MFTKNLLLALLCLPLLSSCSSRTPELLLAELNWSPTEPFTLIETMEGTEKEDYFVIHKIQLTSDDVASLRNSIEKAADFVREDNSFSASDYMWSGRPVETRNYLYRNIYYREVNYPPSSGQLTPRLIAELDTASSLLTLTLR